MSTRARKFALAVPVGLLLAIALTVWSACCQESAAPGDVEQAPGAPRQTGRAVGGTASGGGAFGGMAGGPFQGASPFGGMMGMGMGMGMGGGVPEETESNVFRLEHIPPEALLNVLKIFEAPYVRIVPDSNLNVIAVNAPRRTIIAIAEIIDALDVPQPDAPAPRNLEITCYLIKASQEGAPPNTTDVPPQLGPVVAQLTELSGLKTFGLWDNLFVRCREGEGVQQDAYLPDEEGQTQCEISCAGVSLSQNEPGVRIGSLRLALTRQLPPPPPLEGPGGRSIVQPVKSRPVTFMTGVDLDQGQMAVIGKLMLPEMDTPVFVILTAQVL